MRSTISVLIVISILFIVFNSMVSRKTGTLFYDPVLQELTNRLNSQQKFDPEYRNVFTQINAYERKFKEKLTDPTSPDQYEAGLLAVKTNHLGQTYSPGNNQTEFNWAVKHKNKSFKLINWQHRGPYPISGRARVIVVDKNDLTGNTWFVGSVGGGIWKTTNSGSKWVNKTPDFTSLSTSTIAQSESNPNVIYVGTGQGYGRTIDLTGNGIWKSVDGGESWSQLASTANLELYHGINRILVDPSNPDIVLVCSNNSYTHYGVKEGNRNSGIFRSIDGGSSWLKVFDPDAVFGTATDNRVQQLIAEPGNFNRIYATVNEVGIIYSNDSGETWLVSNQNMALPADIGVGENNVYGGGVSTRIEMAIARTDVNRLYAAVERPQGVADLYMSKDRGQDWTLINDSGNDPNWFSSSEQSGAVSYQAGWFDNAIIVHPFNKNIVFVGGVHIYRLTVDELSNTRSSLRLTGPGKPAVHADHHYFAIISNETNQTFRLLNTHDGGLSYSDDAGINWTNTFGMLTSQLYGIDKKPGENSYIIGVQDNGTWFSGNDPNATSTNWFFASGGDGVETVWNFEDPDLMMGGSQAGNLVRSTDGGLSWESVFNQNSGVGPFITRIANSKQNPDVIANVGFKGVTISDDFGDSWSLTSIPTNWLGYRAFDNIKFSLANPQIVWISSRLKTDPILGKTGGIHVSVDGGLSFNMVSQHLPATLTESSGIGTSSLNPGTAYLLFSAKDTPKIMRTTDMGETWLDISGFTPMNSVSSNGFPNVATFCLLEMPYNTNILWAGTEIGLFISVDNGISWSYSDNGLPHVAIFNMKISDGQIFLATHSNGIYTVDLPELADYQPPQVTVAPAVSSVAQHPLGYLEYKLRLKSEYDSSKVQINGQTVRQLTSNSKPEISAYTFQTSQTGLITINAIAYKNGAIYKSLQKSTQVFDIQPINSNFSSLFNSVEDTAFYFGTQHSILAVNGSDDLALHFPHPYTNSTEYIVQLKTPILIQNETSILEYKDIALVEPGDPGSVFGQTEMWDYVVVEGSKDGNEWLPLEDGYDARFSSTWLNAFNTAMAADASMYVNHQLNLQTVFQAGDVIFIRFRLSADAGVTGYGWIIDDIKITGKGNVTLGNANSYSLLQNYPNPFNPSTTIQYELKQAATISINVYNQLGQKVAVLVDGLVEAGKHEINWNGRNTNNRVVSSGIYFYQLISGKTVISKKMVLIR